MSQYTLPTSRGTRIVLADEGLEGGAKRVLAVHQAQFAAITVMAPSYGIAPGDPDLHVMTGKIGSTHGNSCPSRDDSRKREAAGGRDLHHYFFLPGFTDGEVERRDPEDGEQLFHRILGGVDGDYRSGCFRCTPVAVENVHSVCSLSQPLELAPDPRLLLLPQPSANELGHHALGGPSSRRCSRLSASCERRRRWASGDSQGFLDDLPDRKLDQFAPLRGIPGSTGCLLLPPAPTGELGFRVQARVHPVSLSSKSRTSSFSAKTNLHVGEE